MLSCNLISLAAEKINKGEVVAFPTETVYGLGANAFDNAACKKIYSIKSRPHFNPLIVHVSSVEEAQNIGNFSNDSLKIAEAFWPGPVSIVVKLENSKICPSVTAGLDTIAIRIPAHEIALQLLKESKVPIAAPSANPSNYISPTIAEHVKMHFEKEGIMILDGGKSSVGLESTIIDCSGNQNIILRHGSVTKDDFEKIGIVISNSDDISKIIAPGMMQKHYSPKTKIRLNAVKAKEKEIGLDFGSNIVMNSIYSLNLSSSGNLLEAASNLYSMLRDLDNYAEQNNIQSIAIAEIPNIQIGIAINDKLQRAASL